MPVVACPSCAQQMVVVEADLGHEVECPTCLAAFTPPRPAPPRRRPRDRRDDDEDEEYDRPRRRRRRSRRDEPVTAEDYDEARRRTTAPGTGLLVTGLAGMAVHLILGVGLLVFAMIQITRQPVGAGAAGRAPGPDGVVFLALGGLAMVGVPYCLGIAWAGYKLRRIDQLTGTTWVSVGCSLAIVMVLLCGIYSAIYPVAWGAITFGIWGLVAVNHFSVSRVIRENARRAADGADGAETG